MKFLKSLLVAAVLIFFSSQGVAQDPPAPPAPAPAPAPAPVPQPAPAPAPAPVPQPAPAPAPGPEPAPSPAPSGKSEIPIIKMEEIKPIEPEKPAVTERGRPRKTPPKAPKTEEIKATLNVQSKELIHSRASQIGDKVLLALNGSGTLIRGSISEITKMQKDQPGQIKISLESLLNPSGGSSPLSGTVTYTREKGADAFGGKEVFVTPGAKQSIPLSKRISVSSKPKVKPKAAKGLVTATAEFGKPTMTVRLGTLKYPSVIDIYVEPTGGVPVDSIKDDSLKLVAINDVQLPSPLTPDYAKIRIADHDRNNIQELNYRFDGWEVIRYLPEGSSTVQFIAVTKDGRPVEGNAKVNLQYE